MRLRTVSMVMSLVMLLQVMLTVVVSAGAYDPELKESEHVTTGHDMFPAMIINDFNTPEDVGTWRAGKNTKEIQYVTSILNGPNSPFEGAGALEQNPDLVKVYEWRTIYREFEEPLDLSDYRFMAFAANSWGWQGSADYVVKVNLYSGEDKFESTAMIRPDSWKRVFIKLADWAGRNAVTKMEVSFMQNFDLDGVLPGQPGYDYWNGRFQIDNIIATNVIDMTFNNEGETEGFTAVNGSLESADGKLGYTLNDEGTWIESPELQIDASKRNGMEMTMTNGTGSNDIKIQWKTEESDWNEENSKTFTIPSEGTFTHDFNFSDHMGWNGVIKGFRVIPAASSGTLSFDEIRLRLMPAIEKPYDGKAGARIEGDGRIVIEGTVKQEFVDAHPSERLYLLELATYESVKTDLVHKLPLADTALANTFRFESDIKDGQRSRLYSKFVVAARLPDGSYEPIDAPQYITNAEVLAGNHEAYPEAQSIKGLQVQMTADAQELGISHAALNVPYNELMYKSNNHPENTIPYEVEGETFYFRKSRIEQLDIGVKSLSDNGMIVSLILIMYNTKDPDSANEYLIHPDSEPGGTVYALNTSNEIGVKYVKAATQFIAERYSMPNGQYGRAVNYIVGNEVGQNKVWNNMGPKHVDAYVREYAQTLRLVDSIVKSTYANARTYVSLDHFWNEKLSDDSTWKYDNKVIVDRLISMSHAEGNFSWNIAPHPYPEDLFNPRFWNDSTATDSFDTQRITFKNLEVLVDYMKQDDYLFNGEMRRIMLSEQGFHSLTNSEEHQKLQAAAYAYAYYKVKFLDGIDAFILHRHVDHGEEGGLNLGLWTHAPNTVVTPDQHKYIYDVFKYIDTDRSLEVTEFAKEIIGIKDWKDAIPNFDPALLQDRQRPITKGMDFILKADKVIKDGGFESGADGYVASENVGTVINETGDAFQGEGYLRASIGSLYSLNWSGVQKTFDKPVDVRKTPYFTAAVQLPNANPDKKYVAKFMVYSGFDSVEGTAILDPSKGWQQLALPLEGWKGAKSVDRVKIWVRSEGGDPWRGQLWIDEATFAGKVKVDKDYANVDTHVSKLSPELEIGTKISVTVTNHGTQKLKKLQVEPSKELQACPCSISLHDIETGGSKTFTLEVSSYNPIPGIDPKLTLKLGARDFIFPL
ncbi:DUF5722 domain-containing protein [Paenibacillus dakarensis]|uniref:DUF5722 domain-containing protein n=1 Tax=Paenibacillus dakarensis TaxID=1527293 RepID=UPI0006D55401|nr:DUF5722 domain-containing protein [Paenibacillus dakarensis]